MVTKGQAAKILEKSKADPAWFVSEILGDKPWSKQVEILEALRDHKEVAVRSCHGAGKDWIAARAVLWFLYSHSPAVVITTGPTDRQVRGILWKEIRVAHAKARFPLGGDMLQQELKIAPDRFAVGFTTADDPDRFQGWHSPNILVVIDEASGVSPNIYTAIEGLLSSENARKLEIGNPTDPVSEFARSFKTPGIHNIKITAYDTPNFTEFGISQDDIARDTWSEKVTGPLPVPELTTPEWVSKRFKRWLPTNPLYVSRVMADFPEAGIDTLIPLSWIERAQSRTLEALGRVRLAVDVARFGDNMSVIMKRQGPVLRTLMRFGKEDTMTTSGHVKQQTAVAAAEEVVIDEVGLGAGVLDKCREERLPVLGFNGGVPARDTEQFVNLRAECYWHLRDLFETGEIDIDPLDEELAAQLAELKWKPDSKGRTMIESKDDMKRRGVASPDDADAASMTMHEGSVTMSVDTGGKAKVASVYGRNPRPIRWT